MRILFFIIGIIFFNRLAAQSSIGINETFIGGDGLHHELNIESIFTSKIQLSIKLGSNFNGLSTYKLGLRYKILGTNTTKFRLGIDFCHTQNNNIEYGKSSRRTLELFTGLTQDISQRVIGNFEIGLSSKEYSTDVIPAILRIGLGYKF